MTQVIYQGEQITCPACHKPVLIMLKDLRVGMTIDAGLFAPLNGFPAPKNGQFVPACCGKEPPIKIGFDRDSEVYFCWVHTKHGWLDGREDN